MPSGGGGALSSVSVVLIAGSAEEDSLTQEGSTGPDGVFGPCGLAAVLLGPVVAVRYMGPPEGDRDRAPATCALTLSFAAPTAESVESYLAAKGLPITGVVAFDASTDPNHLLGRPNGYLSKVAWQDPRIPQTDQSSDPGGIEWGGGIEVFPTAAAATSRASYLSAIGQASSVLANEYDYVLSPILMRISGTFIPTTADGYRSALSGSTLYTPTPPGAATTTTAP